MLHAYDEETGRHPRRCGSPRLWGIFVALTFAQVFGSYMASIHGPPGIGRTPDALGFALLLIGPAALFAFGPAPLTGRRLPVTVLGVTLTATVVYFGLGYSFGPAWLSLFAAMINTVAAGYRVVAWVASGAGLLAYFLIVLVREPGHPPSLASVAGHAAYVVIVLGLAEIVRIRRERRAEASRMRLEARRRRASEERLTIAQELHDVLAHNISLINVQAGVGLHLMDEQPEQARSALAAIKQASNETLGELRSVLDVLRAGEAAPRTPSLGLGGLQGLADRTTKAGLQVHLDADGERRTLPVPVELAAFRLVQEALTNVVKHADATAVNVTVHYGDDMLAVTVEDDGRGNATSGLTGTGSGIDGMRRRVESLGGTLSAGPLDGRGFRVHARIPVGGREWETAKP
ncbi:MAG: sensor histidine kinase [Streptosporangiales bacterium]